MGEKKSCKMIMTPWEDLFFVINNLLLGEEPSIEDFILLVGTSVAFIAFILWCCFPIEPKDSLGGSEFSQRRQQTQCTMQSTSSWQRVLPAGSLAFKISCSTTSTPSTPTPSLGARCRRSSYKTATASTLYLRPSRHPAGDTDSLGLSFFS